MTDNNKVLPNRHIDINEYPQPACELYDWKRGEYVIVRTIEDAEAIIESLQRMIKNIKETNDSTRF